MGLGNCPDLLSDERAPVEQQQGWNASNVEFGRCRLVLIDIELCNSNLAVMGTSNLFQYRGDHLAGPAPIGPEIDEHRCFGVQYLFLESSIARMKNFTRMNDFRIAHKPSGVDADQF